MFGIEYQGERPVVVTTSIGTKIKGFYTFGPAQELAKAGKHRLVLYRKGGAWVLFAEFKDGIRQNTK